MNDGLRRLRTDHVDLLQLHEIVHEGEPERIASEGVLEALDATYRSFVKEVLPRARKHGLGIIGMKSLAGGHILQAGVSVDEALAYALSLPVDTVVSGIDSIEVLEQNLSIVRAWNPLTEDEMQGLERQLAEVANDGHLEFYKTSW